MIAPVTLGLIIVASGGSEVAWHKTLLSGLME